MKISGNTALFPWSIQGAAASKKTEQKTAAETISQLDGPAVKLTISKEGLESCRGMMSGGPSLEEIEKQREDLLNREQVFGFNQLNYSIGIHLGETNDLYTVGRDYAEKYDQIVRDHENGEKSMISDAVTGEVREATLEEKLAALDRSFEFCLDFLAHCQEQRPFIMDMEEKNIAWLRENGLTDMADEHQYHLDEMRQIPPLPENFRDEMLRIRENWKAAYAFSPKNQGWEEMLSAISQLCRNRKVT